jgi:DNA-binding CsgD family transcriptional regulator
MSLAIDGPKSKNKGGIRLSTREAEVLSLLAKGNSSQVVADTLFISKRTVDFHLANVYEKLGVDNRVQAILSVGRLGLIPSEPTFGIVRELVDKIQSGPAAVRQSTVETFGEHAEISPLRLSVQRDSS